MVAKPVINLAPVVVSEGYDDNGLYAIKVKLHKRVITVTEPKFGVDDLRTDYAREVMALNIPDLNRKNALLVTYSALAAVSGGDVPKANELGSLGDADVKFWISQARRVAPQLFDWLDEVEELTATQQKAVNKKKGRKRGR